MLTYVVIKMDGSNSSPSLLSASSLNSPIPSPSTDDDLPINNSLASIQITMGDDDEDDGELNSSRRLSFYNTIDNNQDEDNDCDNINDNLSIDSNEFYGRNINDCPGNEEEDEDWFRYLNESDRRALISGPLKVNPEDWTDVLISDVGEDCELVLDSAKKEAWEHGLSEISHVRSRVQTLLKKSEEEAISTNEIMDLAFGAKSEFYLALSSALNLTRLQFIKFFGTVCLQMSYKETVTGLYDELSLLKNDLLMEEKEMLEIYQKLAEQKKVNCSNFIGASRRDKCVWELLEEAVNKFLRMISIVNRDDEIPISLDDDKIWVETSGRNDEDHFGLRKVTHVKDNRKGIISHTAVSTAAVMPLGFMFERKGNNAVSCFSKLFSTMFPSNEFGQLPNLNSVMVHSDRGYTLESTLFQFLMPSGANFTNTCKRIEPFPFLWGMKPKNGDTRTILTETGCPALYIKDIVFKGVKISCFAFRTGTGNISTVVSSSIEGHQWEGVCLSAKERKCWEDDKCHGLDKFLFLALATHPEFFDQFKEQRFALFDQLRAEEVDVLTLDQGSACWHKGRQNSFTSSQSDGAFSKAFIVYQDKLEWCHVGTHLEGEEYHRGKHKLCSFYLLVSSLLFISS